jgi:UDP-N-acetylglucosamine--N-acetylmuramyl-(pentapeptide) pyrophosphoryl-undecaprenol N-acetylglucosamine transferase
MLAPYVESVILSFEESKRFFKKQSNLKVMGNPIRSDLLAIDRDQAYHVFDLDPAKITLFVFGGSQGSRSINQAVQKLIPKLVEMKEVQLIWSTGPRWVDEIQAATTSIESRARIYPYIENMGSAYSVSDLVICRSGATTLAELTSLGLPSILIPYPASASGHQEQNARILVEVGAAEMILETELQDKILENRVFELLMNPGKRLQMGIKAKEMGKPEAAAHIAQDLIGNRSGV